SLARLQRLRFDEVKIDKSFVLRMAEEATDRKIVWFATDLAHSLGMTVVAEGVESPAAVRALRECEVEMAQGYLLSRPVEGPILVDRIEASPRFLLPPPRRSGRSI